MTTPPASRRGERTGGTVTPTAPAGRSHPMPATLTLIAGGDVYAPEPLGPASVVVVGRRVLRVARPGEVDRRALAAVDPEAEVIDAGGGGVVAGRLRPPPPPLRGRGGQGLAHPPPAGGGGPVGPGRGP